MKRPSIRDLFLLALALAILYDQVLVARSAQPILVFLIIFLLGCIPAIRGDAKPGTYGPFARIVMLLLGIHFPESMEDEDEDDGTGSSQDTPTSSDGPPHASQRDR